MLTTGVDIIEIDRIQAALERWGQRFLHRIYTEGEIAYCRGRPPNLAGRFAAKEAAMKALGTGLRGVGWKDVEVIRGPGGKPSVRLHGRALLRAEKLGVTELALSLSHSRGYAVAFVVGVIPDPAEGQP
jgi:holo-[acyl-carrier protein] synthase